MWFGRGSNVVRRWLGGGSDLFSDLVQTVWQRLRESGFQHGIDLCFNRCALREGTLIKKNPWDTGRVSLGHLAPAGQTSVYRSVSQGLPVVYYRKLDRKKKGLFAGTPARCPRHTGGTNRAFFSDILCDFLSCAFLLPIGGPISRDILRCYCCDSQARKRQVWTHKLFEKAANGH